MFYEYLSHISSDPALALCSALMLLLFFGDLLGLASQIYRWNTIRHIDFKSPIVSIGIFGTFLGILTGLYGFDSANIAESVPSLLEGLKFAFATSVLGMFLSLLLAVTHKICGSVEGETALLENIDNKLGYMSRNMQTLVTSIESPTELVKQFSEMKGFLKDELTQINTSLDKALIELAQGATGEVVKALEGVIREFNTNLEEQFGENFKELNAACLKLLEWQENYRDHVDRAESHLTQIRESLDVSARSAKELVHMHQETKEICEQVGGLIKVYDVQVKTLATHLESCRELGLEAKQFLSATQSSIRESSENLAAFSGVIENSVGKQSEALARLTQDIDKQLPKALGELEDVLTGITNKFAGDYKSLFEFVTRKR